MYTPTIPQDLVRLANGTPWPQQGEWTYEDYLRLPDDGRRYEIIFGVLYVNAAPNVDHQYAVSQINYALTSYVRDNQLGYVFTSPIEVHLKSIAHPVEPDILFITPNKLPPKGSQALIHPPDLIVEVLSPSTRRKDMSTKLDAYELSGVREYWIVDPRIESVTVYTLPEGGREYVELDMFVGNSQITSHVLPDLQFHVSDIFR